MKIIHTIMGMVIIVVRLTFLSTTIEEAPVRNVMLKVYGSILVFMGTFYLKKIAKLVSK